MNNRTRNNQTRNNTQRVSTRRVPRELPNQESMIKPPMTGAMSLNQNRRRNRGNPATFQMRQLIKSERREGQEKKFYDTVINPPAGITTTPTIQNLTLIPNGAAQSQRVGDTIEIVGVDVRSTFSLLSPEGFAHVRWMVFAWKENSQVVPPTSADVYANIATFGILSPFSYDTRQNYHIVSPDNLVNLVGFYNGPLPTIAGLTNHTSVDIQQRYKSSGHETVFASSAVQLGTNQLYLIAYSDSTIAPNPIAGFVVRVWYYD